MAKSCIESVQEASKNIPTNKYKALVFIMMCLYLLLIYANIGKYFVVMKNKPNLNELCKKKDYYLILTKKNALFATNNIN